MVGFMMDKQAYALVTVILKLDHDGKPVEGLNVTYN